MKDKENQINVSTKEEIEERNKKGKEKDELKQALLHYATAEASGGIKSLIDCEGCAFYLYEMLGYRKLPEDSVVLSREELEEKYEPSEKFMSVARELEELKQNLEDSVVITKREYDSLQCYKNKVERTCVFFTVQEWDEFCDGDGELPKTVLITAKEQAYEKGSKETAEKILNKVYSKLTEPSTWKQLHTWWLYNGECEQLKALLNEIATREGVEIKE